MFTSEKIDTTFMHFVFLLIMKQVSFSLALLSILSREQLLQFVFQF